MSTVWSIDLTLSLCVYFFSQSRGPPSTMNKMKNFKRRFSLSVPRTETIEENEFTEQINQLNICHTTGLTPDRLGPPSHDASPLSPEPTTPGAESPSHLDFPDKAQHRRFSIEVW
ncbi:Cyclin-dependent kinase 18 [Liparis tanakae]|uniref:Cyclin-dependent kinase 18 n=1 Tax=Liparis tanakae TaxID=230148 RepID=A0A4Z2FZB2_9TELE|nr:Cyclin-dependent kinase 18 [Liparis tanakae]